MWSVVALCWLIVALSWLGEGDAVLPADKGEAFAEFQEEGLKVVAKKGLQVGLGDRVRLWDFEEFKDKGITEKIARLSDDLALRGELEDGVFVLSGGEAEEE